MDFVGVWGLRMSIPKGSFSYCLLFLPRLLLLPLTPQDQTEWELCIQGKCSRHGGANLNEACRPSTMVGVLNLPCSSLRSIVSKKRWILGMGNCSG